MSTCDICLRELNKEEEKILKRITHEIEPCLCSTVKEIHRKDNAIDELRSQIPPIMKCHHCNRMMVEINVKRDMQEKLTRQKNYYRTALRKAIGRWAIEEGGDKLHFTEIVEEVFRKQ